MISRFPVVVLAKGFKFEHGIIGSIENMLENALKEYEFKDGNGKWKKWRIGGIFKNQYIWALHNGVTELVTSAFVEHWDVKRTLEMISRNVSTVLVYEPGKKSEWITRFNVLEGGEFEDVLYPEEWNKKVGEEVWELKQDDLAVVLECSI